MVDKDWLNLLDNRINKKIDLKSVENAPDPKKEWQTQVLDFLWNTPHPKNPNFYPGRSIVNHFDRNPDKAEDLFEKGYEQTISINIETGEISGPIMTEEEAKDISMGIPIGDRFEIIPNLNEDTIIPRYIERNWTVFYRTIQTKKGDIITLERYRDKKTGRFIKKPPLGKTRIRIL